MQVRRPSRTIHLLAALALFALAVLSGAPDRASAQTCNIRFYRVNYYAEPEKINLVGVCTGKCSGVTTCTGTETDYETIVYNTCCI